MLNKSPRGINMWEHFRSHINVKTNKNKETKQHTRCHLLKKMFKDGGRYLDEFNARWSNVCNEEFIQKKCRQEQWKSCNRTEPIARHLVSAHNQKSHPTLLVESESNHKRINPPEDWVEQELTTFTQIQAIYRQQEQKHFVLWWRTNTVGLW